MCLPPQPLFGLQPIRPLQSCMLDHLVDMPILNLMFGRSCDAAPVPKPMIKRRASPLKESPARDEEDETSDCPMEQVDYDADSDDDDSDEEGHPLEGRPLSKAMPHPKLVPESPPPTLRLVSKVKPAPKNTLDDETESDNHPGDRPALPRRPVMRPVLTSNDRWFVTYGSDTDISLQKESVEPGPFGNSKFLTFVHEYYKECPTILDVNPDFHFVPEHERPHGVKVFWLQARFNDYWHPRLKLKDLMQRSNTWTSSRRSTASAATAMLNPKFTEPTSSRWYATTATLILIRPSRMSNRFAHISALKHPRRNRSQISSSGELRE